jgi:hypothetical protein
MAAALTIALSSSGADARGGGGGHAGGDARAAVSPSRLAAPYSPAEGLPGLRLGPGAGLQSMLAGGRFSGHASRLAGSAPAPQGMRQPLALPRLSGTAPAALLPGAPSARARPAHPSPTTTQSTTTSTTHHPPSTPDATTTPSAIAASMPLPAPIAPLPPQLQSQFAIGGTLQSKMVLSPAQGGGGKTLADSMGFWDRETHMSKAEWKVACLEP